MQAVSCFFATLHPDLGKIVPKTHLIDIINFKL